MPQSTVGQQSNVLPLLNLSTFSTLGASFVTAAHNRTTRTIKACLLLLIVSCQFFCFSISFFQMWSIIRQDLPSSEKYNTCSMHLTNINRLTDYACTQHDDSQKILVIRTCFISFIFFGKFSVQHCKVFQTTVLLEVGNTIIS
eukprot:scpid81996/ scgid26075/ 